VAPPWPPERNTEVHGPISPRVSAHQSLTRALKRFVWANKVAICGLRHVPSIRPRNAHLGGVAVRGRYLGAGHHVPARTLVPVYIDFIEVPAKADGLINGPRSHCEIHGTGALNDIERQSIHFHTGRVLVYNNGVFLKPYARYNITILIASTRTARRNEQQGDKAIHEHDQGYCPRERFPSRSGVFNRRSARLRAHMLPIPDFGKRLP